MTDIFISYKREEQAKARALSGVLEDQGWVVWWDLKLRTGQRFDDVIEQSLQEATCVIVLWSSLSVTSDYVKDEASRALQLEKLIPVFIEEVELPFRFSRLHTASLIGWDGTEEAAGLQSLIADISTILGPPPVTTASARRQQTEITPSARKRAEKTKWQRKNLERDEKTHPPEPLLATSDKATANTQTTIPPPLGHRNNHALMMLATLSIVTIGGFIWKSNSTAPLSSPLMAATQNTQTLDTGLREINNSLPGKSFHDTLENGTEGPEMVIIPPGSFDMGDLQGNGDADEQPVHPVHIAKPFSIGRYEVTFEQYDQYAAATKRTLPNDEGWSRGHRPVINVSWEDARNYAAWLSQQTNKPYRLPSEAEWEYAARANAQTAYWWGNEMKKERVNCDGCDTRWGGKQTAVVGSFPANPFGLFDTAGNVWEWTQDCWHESYHNATNDGSAWLEANDGHCDLGVLRGGSWANASWYLRSSFRSRHSTDTRTHLIGFRLARDLD